MSKYTNKSISFQEFCDTLVYGYGIVTAVVRVQSLAQELLYALGVATKTKTDYISSQRDTRNSTEYRWT